MNSLSKPRLNSQIADRAKSEYNMKFTLPFQGCQRNVEDWQKIIQVRSLVVNPQDDLRTYLKYASLCRKSGRMVSYMELSNIPLKKKSIYRAKK